MQTTWAYISNYSIYSAMAVFALSFLAHAFETAWAVRSPELADSASGNTLNRTFDYTRTERAKNCNGDDGFSFSPIVRRRSRTWTF